MTTHILNILKVVIVMIVIFMSISCETKESVISEKRFRAIETQKDTIAIEMNRTLDAEFESWYPVSIDKEYGGFFSDLDDEWKLDGRQTKMIVTQARHVWSAANASMFYKNNDQFQEIAGHGAAFLRGKMWDNEFGGFYNLVDRQGTPIAERGEIIKQAYGNAFAIYGLAACYKATGDTAALSLAKETFRWMERHSHDPHYGGYFQFMKRDGTPFTEGYNGTPPKDYNSMIHILECFTELYKVWSDPTLATRLHSMLTIVRDTVASDAGYLKLYFNRDWTHISNKGNFQLDHISFGHDVETAYLMLEASEALELKNDTTTIRIAKKMVDHALEKGFDQDQGGLYDGGYYHSDQKNISITKNSKEWWSQVEAFNAFLLMSKLFPNDERRYYDKFCQQWNYCMNYLIDHDHGGWYWGGIDIEPDQKYSPKGSIWKCNYHTSRALINCINALNE